MTRPAEFNKVCLQRQFANSALLCRHYPRRKAKAPVPVQPRQNNSRQLLANALPLRQRLPLEGHLGSWWLALRAGVLRRAVSSSVRPLLHRGTSSGSVGRMPLRSGPALAVPRSCPSVSSTRSPQVSWFNTLPPVRPNRSLNRTHCGMRPKARHFILGL